MKTIIFVTLIMLSQELMADDRQKIYLAANLSIDGESVVWPVISLPGEKKLSSKSNYCDAGEISCALLVNKTLAALDMSRDRKLWFDAKGAEYKVQSGYHNTNPLGGVGEELDGFVISDKRAKKASVGRVRFAGAMASVPGLISIKSSRNIYQADQAEIERIVALWKKKYFKECGEYCTTPMRIAVITRVKSLGMKVTEYKLPSGKILQHITGNSYKTVPKKRIPSGGSDLYLIFDVWKYADVQSYIDYDTRVESIDCETQCGGGWDDPPDVFEYRNSVYILGGRNGGTVYGYYLFKVKANTLKPLAWLTGGS